VGGRRVPSRTVTHRAGPWASMRKRSRDHAFVARIRWKERRLIKQFRRRSSRNHRQTGDGGLDSRRGVFLRYRSARGGREITRPPDDHGKITSWDYHVWAPGDRAAE